MKKFAWILFAGLLAGCAEDWSAGLGGDHAAGPAATTRNSSGIPVTKL